MKTKRTDVKEKEIILKDGIKQIVLIREKQNILTYSNPKLGKVFVGKDFLKLNSDEQMAIIYHERGHFKKSINIIQRFFNLFLFLSEFAVFLLFVSGIAKLLFLLKIVPATFLFNNLYFQFTNTFIIILIIGLIGTMLSSWLIELYCDFNALKNTNKEVLISAMKRGYKYQAIRMNKKLSSRLFWFAPILFSKIILHPPHKLRFKLISELD